MLSDEPAESLLMVPDRRSHLYTLAHLHILSTRVSYVAIFSHIRISSRPPAASTTHTLCVDGATSQLPTELQPISLSSDAEGVSDVSSLGDQVLTMQALAQNSVAEVVTAHAFVPLTSFTPKWIRAAYQFQSVSSTVCDLDQ